MTDLQNLSIGTKEGWDRIVHADPVPRPEILSARKFKSLNGRDLSRYNKQRRLWHANMGVLHTEQLQRLHHKLWDIMNSNQQNGSHAKGAIAVEGDSNLGKSTAVELFAKEFHLSEIAENGDRTDTGNERHPVVRVTLSGHPTISTLNKSLLYYFAHMGLSRGNADDFARRALDVFLACEVRLLIVDDLHFLRWESVDGSKVSNQLKFLANEFPITLLLVGVGLTQRGLYRQGRTFGASIHKPSAARSTRPPSSSGRVVNAAVLGPTANRTTQHELTPFQYKTADDKRYWRTVVKAIEDNLVLTEHRQGTLSLSLADYLFERSSGYMGSLVTLINRGCARAVRTGAEALTEELLEQVEIDVAAETARKQTARLLRMNQAS